MYSPHDREGRMEKHAATLRSRVSDTLSSIMHASAPRMRAIHTWSMAVATILTILVLVDMRLATDAQHQTDAINTSHQTCQTAVNELRETSDFLTDEARAYVSTGDSSHLDGYLAEVQVRDRRGSALKTLQEHATNDTAIEALESARTYSDELAQTELYAMRLVAEANQVPNLPPALLEVELSPKDQRLSSAKKLERAYELVHGEDYANKKMEIRDQVQHCSSLLVDTLRMELDKSNEYLGMLLTVMRASVVALLLIVAFVIGSTILLLLRPIALYESNIRDDEPLQPAGAQELRFLISAYNDMYAQNHHRTEALDFEAHYDALTGVYNRGAFNELLTEHKHYSALILVDIDHFKQFNDEYGHEMGDAILIEVAATLYASFRQSDYICRIGGDEFAVIMTEAHADLEEVIALKVKKVAAFLRSTENGLPAATVSIGIAFGEKGITDDGLFKHADAALYGVKRDGRDGYAFYREDTHA